MANGVYKVTEEFEKELCRYTGAPYAVAVDNCSNALFLALMYDNIKGKIISIPSNTYPSVPCEIIHAGGQVKFITMGTVRKGEYQLIGSNVWDSALTFTHDMYRKGFYQCLSFTGPYKHLKLGKGGAILTDNKYAYEWFKRARFSGRGECSYHEDVFILGWNFYMNPEISTRGVQLMKQFYEIDGTPRRNADICLPYPDLSKQGLYDNGFNAHL